MPKDEWKREQRRIDSRRSQSTNHRRGSGVKRFPSPRSIPAGTTVLVRKVGSVSAFKQHVTKLEVVTKGFVSATKKAVLIKHGGWHIWVKQSLLVK